MNGVVIVLLIRFLGFLILFLLCIISVLVVLICVEMMKVMIGSFCEVVVVSGLDLMLLSCRFLEVSVVIIFGLLLKWC